MDLGRALGLMGQIEEARAVEADLEALAQSIYVSPFQRAMIALGLGERQRALELLAEAVDQRSWYAVWLPSAPELDGLRDEPAFEALASRVARSDAAGPLDAR